MRATRRPAHLLSLAHPVVQDLVDGGFSHCRRNGPTATVQFSIVDRRAAIVLDPQLLNTPKTEFHFCCHARNTLAFLYAGRTPEHIEKQPDRTLFRRPQKAGATG